MYSLTIKSIKGDVHQETQEHFLDVTVDVLNEADEVVDTKRFGYAYGTPREEIELDLVKFLDNYQAEEANKVKESKQAEDEVNAQEIIEGLTGAKIEPTIKVDLKEKAKVADEVIKAEG